MSLYLENLTGDIKVGFEMFPDRKRPQIVIWDKNGCRSYGSFKSKELATEFMERLANMIGAKDTR